MQIWLFLRLVLVVALAAPVSALPQTSFTLDSAEEATRRVYPNIVRPSIPMGGHIRAVRDQPYAQTEQGPLSLDIWRLNDELPRPVVLIVHGGGWEAGDRSMESTLAAELAVRGWVAVPVSYQLGEAGRFPAPLHDLQSALRWLRDNASRWQLDLDRVAVVGASAGGQLAALLGARNDAGVRLSAVVSLDGLADFTDAQFISAQARQPSAPTRFLGGTYASRPSVWRAASPVHQVGPHSAPTLFMQSTAVTPVLPGRELMRERLQAAGIHSEVIVLPDSPHTFWLFEPWFSAVVKNIDLFLARWLRRPPSGPSS